MPPLFRSSARSRSRAKLGHRHPLPRLLFLGLGAIALGGALVAWTGRRPQGVSDPLATALPHSPRDSGLGRLLGRSAPPGPPLAVPPPMQPLPLPPSQVWPELPLAQGQQFTDIAPDHWAWPLLNDLAQRRLVTGFPDGSLRPTEPMTRAELAAQIAQLFDFPPAPGRPAGPVLYSDLTAAHWAYPSIQKSGQMGFLTGDAEGAFLPDQTVTRIQVIVALANGLMLRSSSGAAPVLAVYRDRDQVPPWAVRQLVAATEAGLVVNYPDVGQLAPQRTATRAEVAAMLHRGLVYIGYLPEVLLPYVVQVPP